MGVGHQAAVLSADEECRQGGVAGAKMRAMLAFLCTVEFYQVIVFCNQKSDGQALAEHLKASGFPAAFISGGPAVFLNCSLSAFSNLGTCNLARHVISVF